MDTLVANALIYKTNMHSGVNLWYSKKNAGPSKCFRRFFIAHYFKNHLGKRAFSTRYFAHCTQKFLIKNILKKQSLKNLMFLSAIGANHYIQQSNLSADTGST